MTQLPREVPHSRSPRRPSAFVLQDADRPQKGAPGTKLLGDGHRAARDVGCTEAAPSGDAANGLRRLVSALPPHCLLGLCCHLFWSGGLPKPQSPRPRGRKTGFAYPGSSQGFLFILRAPGSFQKAESRRKSFLIASAVWAFPAGFPRQLSALRSSWSP